MWWYWTNVVGSNPQPFVCQATVLTISLPPRMHVYNVKEIGFKSWNVSRITQLFVNSGFESDLSGEKTTCLGFEIFWQMHLSRDRPKTAKNRRQPRSPKKYRSSRIFFPEARKEKWRAEQHRGSIRASDPIAPGLNLRVSKEYLYLSWCWRDLSVALRWHELNVLIKPI